MKLFAEKISSKSSLTHVLLNLGFNDAKSYGLIESFKRFSLNKYKQLALGYSNNEFRDVDV